MLEKPFLTYEFKFNFLSENYKGLMTILYPKGVVAPFSWYSKLKGFST